MLDPITLAFDPLQPQPSAPESTTSPTSLARLLNQPPALNLNSVAQSQRATPAGFVGFEPSRGYFGSTTSTSTSTSTGTSVGQEGLERMMMMGHAVGKRGGAGGGGSMGNPYERRNELAQSSHDHLHMMSQVRSSLSLSSLSLLGR